MVYGTQITVVTGAFVKQQTSLGGLTLYRISHDTRWPTLPLWSILIPSPRRAWRFSASKALHRSCHSASSVSCLEQFRLWVFIRRCQEVVNITTIIEYKGHIIVCVCVYIYIYSIIYSYIYHYKYHNYVQTLINMCKYVWGCHVVLPVAWPASWFVFGYRTVRYPASPRCTGK